MVQHRMTAEAAAGLLRRLTAEGVDVCVGGGWAVDALLGRQTRDHSDLDVWVTVPDFEPLLATCAAVGVDRVLPWPGDRPWNFVLHDGGRLRVDLHVYEVLSPDSWHYGSVSGGQVLPAEALAGSGVLGGEPVRCEAPQWALRWHTGYPPRAVDHHDVPLLCERFGLALPEAFAHA